MKVDLETVVLAASRGTSVEDVDVVQSLWSGYGQILRCRIEGGTEPSVIVKHVRWPDRRDHPYGWVSDLSHERKVKSYRIEANWYERYASDCVQRCRVPRCLALEARDDGLVMVLEDLDAAGFVGRRDRVNEDEMTACLSWLASFHATFMGVCPEDLWATGTYWHLATRPDELDALEEGPIKSAAYEIDQLLTDCPFQTLVHGDAKLANFCFSHDGSDVAAVDFQYVGGGCGMKDVAYFISSCLTPEESERLAPILLDNYFEILRDELVIAGKELDFSELEQSWRELYPVAWTDFVRFLKGWSPQHWKLHSYSERLTSEVIEAL